MVSAGNAFGLYPSASAGTAELYNAVVAVVCCMARGFTSVDDWCLINLVFGTRQRSSSCQREVVGISFIKATICAHYASLRAKIDRGHLFLFSCLF